MSDFKKYRRTQVAEMRPFVPGEKIDPSVSISSFDLENGSPKAGDMIARNPKNHSDMWLVSAAYFAGNFELHESEQFVKALAVSNGDHRAG